MCCRITAESHEASGSNKFDVERLFTRNDIQSLLKRLAGSNIREKLFSSRQITQPQRSHYALMTDEAYEKV